MITIPDRATTRKVPKITPAMIDAGASVLAPFDRLEMSESFARQLAKEILRKSLCVGQA